MLAHLSVPNVDRHSTRRASIACDGPLFPIRPAALILCLIGLIVTGSRAQTDKRENLTVIVTGESGPIAGARVNIRPRSTADKRTKKNAGVEGTTDGNGRFTAELPPGTYQVTAYSKGWMPAGGRVVITLGQRKPSRVRLVLRYPDCRVVHCEL